MLALDLQIYEQHAKVLRAVESGHDRTIVDALKAVD